MGTTAKLHPNLCDLLRFCGEGKRLPIAERVLPTGNWRGKVGTIAWPWISWPATSLALRVCHTRTLQPRREACFSESSNVHAVVSALKQLNRNEEAIHTILYNTNNNQNLLIAYYVSSPACSQFFADMIIYHYKSFTCVFFLNLHFTDNKSENEVFKNKAIFQKILVINRDSSMMLKWCYF